MKQRKSPLPGDDKRTYSSRIIKSPRVVNEALVIDATSRDSNRSPSPISSRLLSMESMLDKAREQAQRIVEKAQIEAQSIENEAVDRARQIMARAKEEGYQDGLKRGTASAEAKLIPLLETTAKVAEKAKVERAQLIKESEQSIVALAIDIAKKIIDEEVSANPDLIAKAVDRAIQKVNSEGPVRIRLNPEDLALLAPYWDRIKGSGDKPMKWETVADEQVGRGGCVIDTRYGVIDARIETQLCKVGRTLIELA